MVTVESIVIDGAACVESARYLLVVEVEHFVKRVVFGRLMCEFKKNIKILEL